MFINIMKMKAVSLYLLIESFQAVWLSISWIQGRNFYVWLALCPWLCAGTRNLTHSHSERQKEAWQIWKYFTYKSIFLKTFEGEMLIRSQTTTLLQIFYEILLCSQVIFKSMKVADDTFQRNSECLWVKMSYLKEYLTRIMLGTKCVQIFL